MSVYVYLLFILRAEVCVMCMGVSSTRDWDTYGGTGCYGVMCAPSLSFGISVSNILFGLTVYLSFIWLPILASL